ncbi:hypothetical protein [Nostoc sp.]|uniref:hypothetical protein n=1 Tax=Nostoc sp. TaxID=1180 RepID=UPI002FF8E5DA
MPAAGYAYAVLKNPPILVLDEATLAVDNEIEAAIWRSLERITVDPLIMMDKLQRFRATTGVPYEILVDVIIRNWENLPQRTQSSYLQQAKQLRVNRLMAGQEKTLKTMKAKYLQP